MQYAFCWHLQLKGISFDIGPRASLVRWSSWPKVNLSHRMKFTKPPLESKSNLRKPRRSTRSSLRKKKRKKGKKRRKLKRPSRKRRRPSERRLRMRDTPRCLLSSPASPQTNSDPQWTLTNFKQKPSSNFYYSRSSLRRKSLRVEYSRRCKISLWSKKTWRLRRTLFRWYLKPKTLKLMSAILQLTLLAPIWIQLPHKLDGPMLRHLMKIGFRFMVLLKPTKKTHLEVL